MRKRSNSISLPSLFNIQRSFSSVNSKQEQSDEKFPSTVTSRLSKEELSHLAKLFQNIDTDKSGVINLEEFKECLGLLGFGDTKLSEYLFRAFDKNGDGKVEYREFLVHLSILMKGDITEKLELAFRVLDLDNDGKISKEEFRKVAYSMMQSMDSMNLQTQSQMDVEQFTTEVFQEIDKEGKGYITKEEYMQGARKNNSFLQGFGFLNQEFEALEEVTEHERGTESLSPAVPGTAVSFGSQRWTQVLNMMIGIRIAGDLIGELKREVKKEDFSVRLQFDLPKSKTQGNKVIFKDFAPNVFKALRKLSGMTENEYAMSIGPEQILGNLLLGKLTSLKEKISDGKSGSFFFYSTDGKFMIKTISKEEAKNFKQLLPGYYNHLLKNNKDTLMVRIFGFHKMQNTYFVVQGSVFGNPEFKLSEIYDLKGSTIGRTNPNGKVKKDLDLKRTLHIGPEQKKKLMEILKRDVDFFEKHNVIDYSFLIGIHNAEPSRRKSVFIQRKKSSKIMDQENLTPRKLSINLSSSMGSSYDASSVLSQSTPTLLSTSLAQDLGMEASSPVRNPASTTFATAPELEHPQPGGHHPQQALFYYLNNYTYEAFNAKGEKLPEVYFMGVIDVFTEFNMRKQSEYALKKIEHPLHPDGISVQPADKYAARFLKFIDSKFD